MEAKEMNWNLETEEEENKNGEKKNQCEIILPRQTDMNYVL